ncbi:MAG: PIN domain-containing protein [Candidatus Levyibacteriota bacterium]
MTYLFDTDTLIDYFNDYGETRQSVLTMLEGQNKLAVCAVTIAEIYSGLAPGHRVEWKDLINSFTYWHVDREVAKRAGTDRYTLARSGKTIPATDALIGALAREHGATVLTSNHKDYPFPDVTTLSLRDDDK